MNVVDSSAWIEYFGDGPNASDFAAPIEDSTRLVVPSLVLFEVFKRLATIAGDDAALKAVAVMLAGEVVDLNSAIALDAVRISLGAGLAMADSIILATARMSGATLWTQDAHFEGLAGVEYRAKSRERRSETLPAVEISLAANANA